MIQEPLNPFKMTQERKPIFASDTMTVSEEQEGIPFEKFTKQTKNQAPSLNARGINNQEDIDKQLNNAFPTLGASPKTDISSVS